MSEDRMLEIAIRKLSEAFDNFIGSCLTDDEKPKMPDHRSLIKARGYLPPYCKHALSKKLGAR